MNDNAISFKALRRVISRIDKISIVVDETKDYFNYETVMQIPNTYDDYIVLGVGVVDSEFKSENGSVEIHKCLEILLSK